MLIFMGGVGQSIDLMSESVLIRSRCLLYGVEGEADLSSAVAGLWASGW